MKEITCERPWKATALMIVSAKDRQILHLGGSRDGTGEMIEPDILCKIAKMIVDGVNSLPADYKVE